MARYPGASPSALQFVHGFFFQLVALCLCMTPLGAGPH